MSDKILRCEVEKDLDESVIRYLVVYKVTHGLNQETIAVTIAASEMVVPTSQAEAIALANHRAAAMKQSWVDSVSSVSTTVLISDEQDVLLGE